MSLRSDWNAIAARVGALIEVSQLFALRSDRMDPSRAAEKSIAPEGNAIFTEIKTFLNRHRGILPLAASTALQSFVDAEREWFTGQPQFDGWIDAQVPRLATLRSAVDYHLIDFSAHARRTSERAFIHLQRSIVADPEIRDKWEGAFEDGEVACEKLGGAHLLLHGVWAFKSHASGERTDLILGEPITDLAEIEATSEALVLTEWKLVPDREAAEAIADSARQQAALYGVGSLAGIELATYRYIVLVSQKRIEPLPDREISGAMYHHVNIAVSPETPSRNSRRARTRSSQ